MKNVLISLYSFDELNEAGRDHVRNACMDSFWQNYCDMAYECMLEDLKQTFPNSELNVQFDFSCSQGSGLNIYGHLSAEDALAVLRSAGKSPVSEEQEEHLRDIWQGVSFVFPENQRYTYSLKFRNRSGGVAWSQYGGSFDFDSINGEDLIDGLQVEGTMCTYVEDMERDMYSAWACPDDDEIDEYIRNFDGEYFEDGTLYRGV